MLKIIIRYTVIKLIVFAILFSAIPVYVFAHTTDMDMISVKDWGLAGDGITADSTSFQTIIDNISGNETIYFPDGTYLWDSEVQITKPGIKIIFAKNAKIVVNTTIPTINTFSSVGAIFYVHADDFTVENGTFESSPSANAIGIYGRGEFTENIPFELISTIKNFNVINCNFKGLGSYNIFGMGVENGKALNIKCDDANKWGKEAVIHFRYSKNVIIDNIRVRDSCVKGVAVSHECENVLLSNIIVQNMFPNSVLPTSALGLYIGYDTKNVNVENCIVRDCSQGGMKISRNAENVNVSNCQFIVTDAAYAGLMIQGSESVNIENCTVKTGDNMGIEVLWWGTTNPKDITIKGCNIESSNRNGIYVESGQGILISDNILTDTFINVEWSSKIDILSNIVRSSKYYNGNVGGIYIYKSTNVSAIANNITNTTSGPVVMHGIYATSNINDITIGRNIIYLDSTSPSSNGIYAAYGSDVQLVGNIIQKAKNEFDVKSLTNYEIIRYKQNGGATANRPSSPYLYEFYLDTSLGYPIWWNGSDWVDGTGTIR